MGAFEQIASGIYLEGLAVDSRRDIVWYSDVVGGGVHGLMPDGSTHSFDQERMWTGGIMLNHDGCVLSSGAGGIAWNNPETGKSGWLIDEIDGESINGINEMAPDGTGGIFFGSCDIEMVIQGRPTRPTSIYRLSADRRITKLVDGINFANGITYDPTRQRLFCNDTFCCTWMFDVNADLSLTNKRLLLDKPDADGMALDTRGNLWITGFQSGHLTRVSADGSSLPDIETPARAVTQIRFGGPDMQDYYINTVPADGGAQLKEGVLPTEHRSFLYRGRSEIPGMPIPPANFRLG